MSEDKRKETPTDEIPAGIKPERLSDRLATVGRAGDIPSRPEPQPVRYRHSHFVKATGQMVIGSRMPAPKLPAKDLQRAIKRHQLFTSADHSQRRGLSGGAAAMVVCAMAAGTTIGLVSLLDDRGVEATETAGLSENGAMEHVAASVTTLTEGMPEQELTSAVAVIGDEIKAEPVRYAQASTGGNLVIEDIIAKSGADSVPINITIHRNDSEEYSFIMFRGMKEEFRLTAGFRLKDSWAVSLRDLEGLTLIPPQNYEGPLELEVLLVSGHNAPVESKRVTISFVEETAPQPQQQIIAAAPSEPAPVPHILTAAPASTGEDIKQQKDSQTASLVEEPVVPRRSISAAHEDKMLERAFNLLGEGDVVSARLVLEHLAKNGSGKGALALGQTYDPTFFRAMNTLGGPKADSEKARQWYTVAVQLGQVGAEQRLNVLLGQ